MSSEEALKIIEGKLLPSLSLVPLDDSKRTYGRAFAIAGRDGPQFILLVGNPKKRWRQQTTIVTERWEKEPPDISGVEPRGENRPKSDRLDKQTEHSRTFSDGCKVTNRLRNPQQTNCFNISNALALDTLIRSYAEQKISRNEPNHTKTQSNIINNNIASNHSSEDIKLLEDISKILDQKNIDATTKQRMLEARLGQGKFKRDVIRTWKLGARCVVTGIDIPELLIASHIIPWRESDDAMRLDGANGLLLCSHLDKLFDRHMISFGDNWEILLNNTLAASHGTHLKAVGIDESLRLNANSLSDTDKARVRAHLAKHRQRFMDLNNHT